MALKRTHFGKRLEAFIEAKYGTQTEFARAIGRAQPTIARWVKTENFALTPAVRKMLMPLASKGVNPEYFWNPLVDTWDGPWVVEIDEATYYKIKADLEQAKKERDQLMIALSEAQKIIERLKSNKGN